MGDNIIEQDDFDRVLYWQDVPDEFSCSQVIAESYFAGGICNNSNSYGYFNGGWEYRLMPLNTNLTQKGNDPKFANVWQETINQRIYVGTLVKGEDEKGMKHTGNVINFSYSETDDSLIRYIWIFDVKSMEQVALVPDTIKVVFKHPNSSKNKDRDTVTIEDIYRRKGRMNESVDIFDGDERGTADINLDPMRSGFYCPDRLPDEYLDKLKKDDAPYRDAVIKYFDMHEPVDPLNNRVKNPYVLKYLDDKFYTNTFVNNYISLTNLDYGYTNVILGIPTQWSTNKQKGYVQNMLETYNTLIGNTYSTDNKFGLKKTTNYNERYVLEDNPLKIFSYKCIYMLIRAIIYSFNKNILQSAPIPIYEKIYGKHMIVNKNSNTTGFRMYAKRVILFGLTKAYSDTFKNVHTVDDAIKLGYDKNDINEGNKEVKGPLKFRFHMY